MDLPLLIILLHSFGTPLIYGVNMYNDGHGTAYCGLVRYSNHVRFGKAVFVYGWCGKSKQTPRDPRRCQDFCKESMPRHPKFFRSDLV